MDITRLIIVAVGGQGNLLTSRVIGEAALLSDVPVRMSEIHGMAQRGGVVESAIVLGDARSTIISDGEADLLVGFEPAETLRALGKCNQNTTVITNLSPLSPFTVTTGRATYPKLQQIQDLIQAKTARLIAFDATVLAREAGNVMAVNMVLLGAMARTGILPISAESLKQAIRTKTKKAFVETNLKAFDLGFAAAQ
ncbi:indolepyruvate ferredoxin oxidoreductase subunit beta [Desulfococcus sp.]|uniref:indolepyruvate ferredoxin oxidoreductase subunit beta n=1 Tax=Desulfococcus sp. TaxID=2025834 RepID=UPI0035934D09